MGHEKALDLGIYTNDGAYWYSLSRGVCDNLGNNIVEQDLVKPLNGFFIKNLTRLVGEYPKNKYDIDPRNRLRGDAVTSAIGSGTYQAEIREYNLKDIALFRNGGKIINGTGYERFEGVNIYNPDWRFENGDRDDLLSGARFQLLTRAISRPNNENPFWIYEGRIALFEQYAISKEIGGARQVFFELPKSIDLLLPEDRQTWNERNFQTEMALLQLFSQRNFFYYKEQKVIGRIIENTTGTGYIFVPDNHLFSDKSDEFIKKYIEKDDNQRDVF